MNNKFLEISQETKQCFLEDRIRELEGIIAAEREAMEALRLSEERYRAVVEQSDDIMFDWDFAADIILFSDRYTILFGQPPIVEGLTTNQDIRKRIYPADLPVFEQWISDTCKKAGSSKAEFRKKDSSGNYIWLRFHSTAICAEDGTPLRAVGLMSDITAEKKQYDELTFKSQRDPLTELLNKKETRIRTEALIEAAPDVPGAFFIIDIDNFKRLNDNLGHQFGDNVLVEFTRKVRKFFTENSIVGRIGGDEIAAYQPGIDRTDIAIKAEKLMQALRVSYYGSAAKYNIYGSVGVSCYPDHGRTFDELFHFADIALYESKDGGKDRYTIFQDHMTGSLKDCRTPVEWTEGFLATYFQEDFPFKIFHMLYETKDIDASVQMILELLGQHFGVDRVYIFQEDMNGKSVSNTHEWCAPGIAPVLDKLQNVTYESLGVYVSQYSGEGVFCCPDIRKANREVYEICKSQNIKSLLHCAVCNEGVMTGFIGFDMCKDYHYWTGEEIAVLGYLSRILSVFLFKSDTALRLRTSYRNYVEMLDNLNGYVYVVDPETYRILYANNAVKKLGLDCGQTCYKMAFEADKPCKDCPLIELSEKVPFATKEIYSAVLNGWVNSAASRFKWEQDRDTVLICCTDISKYKKDSP